MNERQQQNAGITAEAIREALGPEFKVKVVGNELELDAADGAAIAWVRPAEGEIETNFRILYRSSPSLKNADDASDERLAELRDCASKEFEANYRKNFEAKGFVLRDIQTDWDDACLEYQFNFWLVRPAASAAEIAEMTRWVKSQPQNDWIY